MYALQGLVIFVHIMGLASEKSICPVYDVLALPKSFSFIQGRWSHVVHD